MNESTDYFSELSKTELMRVVVALATEIYELRDRMSALESALKASGQNLDSLDTPVEPAAYDNQRLQARDAFVRRIFSGLSE